MLPRYTRPVMAAIWSDEYKRRTWYEIEAHAGDAMAANGQIPEENAAAVWSVCDIEFDARRIAEIEKENHHEFLAFLTYISELVGEDNSRFLHFGMTSSDVLDTCFNLQLTKAADILIEDLKALSSAYKSLAYEHKQTVCIGRSHGVHAEPVTFGLKMAYAFAENQRNLMRMKSARDEVAVGAISGATGTFANVEPSVEAYVCEKLGLRPEKCSTQVVPRDRHAMFFATLGIIASSVERVAVELRHLQRTEVLEVQERFSSSQRGSSAMPHKRNPILSENLTGLARIARASVVPALENVVLWHERDMSHSSVERAFGPDATAYLDFALARLAGIITNLVVLPGNMHRNMEALKGATNSEAILLQLIMKGLPRAKAYNLVQRCSRDVWDKGLDFRSAVGSSPEINRYLDEDEINALFNGTHHTRNIDKIFARVFAE